MQLDTLDCIAAVSAGENDGDHHQWQRCEERLPANRQTPAGTGPADRVGAMQAAHGNSVEWQSALLHGRDAWKHQQDTIVACNAVITTDGYWWDWQVAFPTG